MINLVKRDNINLGILETDFDIFTDIINTFSSEALKKDCLLDIEDYIIPDYFKNKITIAIQTNAMLVGYITFEFKNSNNISQTHINKLYVLDTFKNKSMEALLIESVVYVAGEVGSRNVLVSIDEHDSETLNIYKALGFYEVGITEKGSTLSCNVISMVNLRKLNDKFRDIPSDSVDYKSLKLVKKISSGRSGNIYLTEDGKILKMFTSTSFTYIKDREETLRYLKSLNIKEVVTPKNLVYYDGIFVGYIMDYLPDGESLLSKSKTFSFEEKINKIKIIENVMKKMHGMGIYICDLNPDNIFFDDKDNMHIIDCDSFVVKKNVINKDIDNKFIDPIYKIVSEKTDIYSFAVTILQLLIEEDIDKNATLNEVEKIYIKNKNKLPVSFKQYFDSIFKSNERYYLSNSYENYINNMYNVEESYDVLNTTSGKISVIILSFILVVIAVGGYFAIKYFIG